MKRRITLAIITIVALCSTFAFAATSAIAEVETTTNTGDNPGQIIDNPWNDLFTTTPEAPTKAKKTITIDGQIAGTVEEGDNFTLPLTAQYGYLVGNKIYKPGATISNVNEDLTIDSVNAFTISMTDGASIKLDGTHGVKFQTVVSAVTTLDGRNVLSKLDSSAFTTGTLITTYDIYSEIYQKELTMENVKYHDTLPPGQRGSYKNIINDGWTSGVVGTFFAGITGVDETNWVRDFIARGYVQLNYTDDTKAYIHAAGKLPIRSIQAVAQKIRQAGYPGLTPYEKQLVDMYADAE